MFFNKKQTLNSDEYEKLSKKMIDLKEELETFGVKLNVLRTDVDNLRGNFNRKLKGLKKEEMEEEEDSKTKDIYRGILLPE